MNSQQLIERFVAGDTDGNTGTTYQPGNLKIKGNQLIHYSTPILERYNGRYILNITWYSIQTEQIQKKIKMIIPEEKIIVAKRVPSDKGVSLTEYISDIKSN